MLSDEFPSWSDPTDEAITWAADTILSCDGELSGTDFSTIYPGHGRIVWVGDDGLTEEPLLDLLLDYWRGLAREAGGPPRRDAVDPLDLKPVLGYLMMLEVERDGYDARYRLYGSNLAEQGAGRDWTGFRVSEMNRLVQAPAALLFRSCYLAVLRRPAPLYTEHVPPRYQGVGAWRRLILPLADATGACTRLVVGNLPVGHRFLSDAELSAYQAWVRRKP